MKRSTLSIVLAAILSIVLLAACVPTATPTPVPPTSTAAPSITPTATAVPSVVSTATMVPTIAPTATVAHADFPITLTDGLGREVTLSTKPQRIVSLAPSNTEILFAVGAGDQVVGVTKFDNYPPEAQTREQIGGFSAKTISVERIVALEPDLVLAAGRIHQPVIEALAREHIPVVALTAHTFDEVYANIELVGRLTGHKAEADRVVAKMKAQVKAVTTKVSTIPADKRLKVFWEVWDKPLMTAGHNTFIGQMIKLAGGVNIFSDAKESYPKVSPEAVVQRNPDVILGPSTHGKKLTVKQLSQRPGWGEINAVKNARIHLIDGDIVSRPGPRLAQGLQAIAKALYPDLFK